MEWGPSETISILSAIAAVFSAVYARKTYTSTEDLKKHDFALQLQTSITSLRALVADLPAQLKWADRSHKAVLRAVGHTGGSVWDKWSARASALTAEIETISKDIPSEDVKGLGLTDLREQIASVHGLQVRASAIKAELGEMLRADDKDRERLLEDQRAATASRLANAPAR